MLRGTSRAHPAAFLALRARAAPHQEINDCNNLRCKGTLAGKRFDAFLLHAQCFGGPVAARWPSLLLWIVLANDQSSPRPPADRRLELHFAATSLASHCFPMKGIHCPHFLLCACGSFYGSAARRETCDWRWSYIHRRHTSYIDHFLLPYTV